MNLSTVADVYDILRSYVDERDLPEIGHKVVKHLLDTGHSAMQISRACDEYDEIHEALEDMSTDTYNDEDEDENNNDDYMEESDYDEADYSEGTSEYDYIDEE